MGYKTINLQTQVLKGSVKPSKVVEKHQNKTQNDPANRLGIGGADEGGGGNGGWCCERLNKNIHRWLETKFGMFPVSCFPFKLGHSATSDPHPKSNRQQSTHKVHSEKTIYVDCSDKWEYEVISWNKPQSAVIDRDVNNSFKVVAVSTPPTVSKIVDIEFDHFDDIENHRRRSSSRNRDRSNSSASIKSRFEKRLNRIKKMGNENKIAESIEMEEKSEDQEMRSLSSLSKDRITFSSIFGDASLFESEVGIYEFISKFQQVLKIAYLSWKSQEWKTTHRPRIYEVTRI